MTRSRRAYSLVELVVTVAIIGILAFMLIPKLAGLVSGTERGAATRNLDYLNGAVTAFNQAAWELNLAAAADISDERSIYNSLRYRDSTAPVPGSPFLSDRIALVESSSTNTYRARWTGRRFELLMPGTGGTGLDLLKMQASEAQPAVTSTPVPPS